jgi:structural maintenance of chromosome 3 (chondroitin sulfate proteoglycan 6)
LKEYEHLDRSRRALEFRLYDEELKKAEEQLTGMETMRDERRTRHQELYAQQRDVQDQLQSEEEGQLIAKEVVQRLETRKNKKETEILELTRRLSLLQAELLEAETNAKNQV